MKIESVVVDLKSQSFVRYRFPLSRGELIFRTIIIGSGKWWSDLKSLVERNSVKLSNSARDVFALGLETSAEFSNEWFSHKLVAINGHVNLKRHCTLLRICFSTKGSLRSSLINQSINTLKSRRRERERVEWSPKITQTVHLHSSILLPKYPIGNSQTQMPIALKTLNVNCTVFFSFARANRCFVTQIYAAA